MWLTIALVTIILLLVVNMILLMDFNDNPMHNFMDKYNQQADDTAEVLRSLREVTEDMQERLTMLEEYTPSCAAIVRIEERIDDIDKRLTYHIQSTDELKPKA